MIVNLMVFGITILICVLSLYLCMPGQPASGQLPPSTVLDKKKSIVMVHENVVTPKYSLLGYSVRKVKKRNSKAFFKSSKVFTPRSQQRNALSSMKKSAYQSLFEEPKQQKLKPEVKPNLNETQFSTGTQIWQADPRSIYSFNESMVTENQAQRKKQLFQLSKDAMSTRNYGAFGIRSSTLNASLYTPCIPDTKDFDKIQQKKRLLDRPDWWFDRAAEKRYKDLSISSHISSWSEQVRMWIAQTLIQPYVASYTQSVKDLQQLHSELLNSDNNSDLQNLDTDIKRSRFFVHFKKEFSNKEILRVISHRERLDRYLFHPDGTLTEADQKLYVFHRIEELARGIYLEDFVWEKGGSYHGKRWTTARPTDAQIIMHFFLMAIEENFYPTTSFLKKYFIQHEKAKKVLNDGVNPKPKVDLPVIEKDSEEKKEEEKKKKLDQEGIKIVWTKFHPAQFTLRVKQKGSEEVDWAVHSRRKNCWEAIAVYSWYVHENLKSRQSQLLPMHMPVKLFDKF